MEFSDSQSELGLILPPKPRGLAWPINRRYLKYSLYSSYLFYILKKKLLLTHCGVRDNMLIQ